MLPESELLRTVEVKCSLLAATLHDTGLGVALVSYHASQPGCEKEKPGDPQMVHLRMSTMEFSSQSWSALKVSEPGRQCCWPWTPVQKGSTHTSMHTHLCSTGISWLPVASRATFSLQTSLFLDMALFLGRIVNGAICRHRPCQGSIFGETLGIWARQKGS